MSSLPSQQVAPASTPVFALVDCNNFFASCERLFDPSLINKPVAVLSNNDGCVIARSNEVKALGVEMAAPYFKNEALFKQHKVKVFSANFTLYGDISERIISTLKQVAPRTEVYSIDESFLQIDNLGITDYKKWAEDLSARVEKEVGVPVSVGVGTSKTLAKLATELAKKTPELKGACSLVGDPAEHIKALKWLPLTGVWGIGRRHSERLHRLGLRTAYDVVRLQDEWVLKHMAITGLRTVQELRGESCIPLSDFSVDYQQKMASSTRSFGRKIRNLSELEAAIASLSARAAMRLRRKDQLAWQGSTFLRAQLPDRSHRLISTDFRLTTPTAFTGDIIKGAHEALNKIFDPDLRYEKGGVILTNLVDRSAQQMSLLEDEGQITIMNKQDKLMNAVDNLSLRYGKTTVLFASEKVKASRWQSKRSQVSPSYTTRWEHLPTVKII